MGDFHPHRGSTRVAIPSPTRTVRSTDDRVRVAAVRLFAQKGFAATGIREIAREARMTSATLYHYMSSKESLLLDIMEQGQRDLNVAVLQALTDTSSPEERLGVLVGMLVATHATNPMSTRVVDTEIRSLTRNTPSRDRIVRLRDEHELFWQQALEDGVSEGVFDVKNTQLTRLALIAMCTGMSTWFRSDGPSDIPALCSHFIDLALATVRAKRSGQDISSSDVPETDFSLVPHYPWEPNS